jgi:phosphoglycerate dehydrogenase-like enzyme
VHPYLLESDYAILSPHMGGLTQGTIPQVEVELIDNIDSYLETGTPDHAVNRPEDKK